jgi:phosphomannomutase/phosphoglucomutase
MSIFREYDIRGVFGTDLTASLAESIGQAFATHIRRGGGKRVAVGYDLRLSSPVLRSALVSGICATGVDVVDIGLCPTPALYFSLFHLPVDGGVMITASHNPSAFNGFKLCVGRASLFGEQIQHLRAMIDRRDYDAGAGAETQASDFLKIYAEDVVRRFGPFRPIRVVVDCANAAAALIAPEILTRLGCEVIPLYCEPDGRFPNHHPDPTVPENLVDLIAEVKTQRAEVGIAFDGDADRLGVVDEQGQILWGDQITLLFALEILKEHPGASVISEVKASQVLYDEVERHGGKAIMWKAGHSLIKKKMKETGALLAGEVSGHLFFADRHFGYDDAIYAACRLLEIVSKSGRPLSSYFADLPKRYATPEIRVDCPDDRKFQIVERCRAHFAKTHKTIDVDGVRISFDGGWGLIRASNTQPALVLRFESDSPTRLQELEQETRALVAAHVACATG